MSPVRARGEAVLELVVRYHEGMRERRLAPATTSREIRAAFDRVLPEQGVGLETTLSEFEIERLAVEWIPQRIGADPAGGGVFVSGGSMANFSALATARRMKAPIDVAHAGAHAPSRAASCCARAP